MGKLKDALIEFKDSVELLKKVPEDIQDPLLWIEHFVSKPYLEKVQRTKQNLKEIKKLTEMIEEDMKEFLNMVN